MILFNVKPFVYDLYLHIPTLLKLQLIVEPTEIGNPIE